MTPEDLKALGPKLRNPVWRLTHFYWIKDAKGKALRFVPNEAQRTIIEAIYRKGLRKILIPKARQLGMSTVIALIMLDMALFGAGLQGAVIDQTQEDATKKLRGKIQFASSAAAAALHSRSVTSSQFPILSAARVPRINSRLRRAPLPSTSPTGGR